jgi:CheY-like chemotaxis protein
MIEFLGLAKSPNGPSLVRDRLIKAIESLKPTPDVPFESRAWRTYKVLQMRYVQQMDQEQTAYQIGVGVRHLRREQTAAVAALADQLFQQIHPTAQNTFAQDAGLIERDLAWLQDNPEEETAPVNDLLHVTQQLVTPLAANRGVQFSETLKEDLPPAAVRPDMLRQVFISLTTYAIHRINAGTINFTTQHLKDQLIAELNVQSQAQLLPESPSAKESLRTIRLLLGDLSPHLKIQEAPGALTLSLALPARKIINILMVDDNKDVADLFKRYTYSSGYVIEYLSNPDQLFETAERVRPRLILLDIMIPHIDGWEVLGRIRQHPLTQSIPVIVCSVLPERELAFALGATDYLSKPVARAALLKALNQALAEDSSSPR